MGQLILLLSLALAQSPDDLRARELYENGEILYEEGRYEDAIVAFEEAYRLSARPLLLFNIANAQERLGHWEEAHTTLSRYRAYATAGEREVLDRRISNLERRIAEHKSSAPATATAPASSTTAIEKNTPSWAQPLPLAAFTVGAVGIGTGVVLGSMSLAAGAEATASCAVDAGGLLRCPAGAAGALDRETGLALGADIAFVAGAAGLAGGLALSLWGPGGPLALGPGYVGLSGSF
ncbi:MAG: tetratricopeptide repeat protein [Deltaproteobacteria bacterium]|nr:tetratricopeptide repeat protein [Deltaproteobacteria bacterium]